MKKRKWKINWKTVTRNLYIIGCLVVLGLIIYVIKTKGISYFSTIGYFD